MDDSDLDLVEGALERLDGQGQWSGINVSDVCEYKILRECKYSDEEEESG